jgi:hypothetical protein
MTPSFPISLLLFLGKDNNSSLAKASYKTTFASANAFAFDGQ